MCSRTLWSQCLHISIHDYRVVNIDRLVSCFAWLLDDSLQPFIDCTARTWWMDSRISLNSSTISLELCKDMYFASLGSPHLNSA